MRLIDADALKFDIMCVYGSNPQYINWLNHAPTVDAVPVIRCKDCKHYNGEDRDICCPLADNAQSKCGADWFCADAERRTDE